MISIDNDPMTLMRHASMTADTYLADAINDIDDRLGEGYSKSHPELLAAVLQACTVDFATAVISLSIQELARAIEDSVNQVANNMSE